MPDRWESFKKRNSEGVRQQGNTYSVRIRRNGYRFYAGGFKQDVEAWKLRNFLQKLSWEDFCDWYANAYPKAWNKYKMYIKNNPYKKQITLSRLDDVALIKALEDSGDPDSLMRDALKAYLK